MYLIRRVFKKLSTCEIFFNGYQKHFKNYIFDFVYCVFFINMYCYLIKLLKM